MYCMAWTLAGCLPVYLCSQSKAPKSAALLDTFWLALHMLGPTPRLVNKKLCRWGPAMHISTSLSDDPDASQFDKHGHNICWWSLAGDLPTNSAADLSLGHIHQQRLHASIIIALV